MQEEVFNTFKEVRAKYAVVKNWHMPAHFSQSGLYVCLLEGDRQCHKEYSHTDEKGKEHAQYIVRAVRKPLFAQ